MPYITKDRRDKLNFGTTYPQSAGELNYCLTELMIKNYTGNYRKEAKKLFKDFINDRPLSYQIINDIMGAVYGATLEHQRRTGHFGSFSIIDALTLFYTETAAPYEDKKILENGDVYPKQT